MIKITKEELDLLIKLQGIANESGAIQKILDEVDNEINSREKRLLDAEKELSFNEETLAKDRNEYRDLEIEMESRNARLKKSEDYLKNVTTNPEYQALLREMDDNRKKNSEVENQMIALLDQIETREKDVIEKKKSLEILGEQLEKEIDEIKKNSINDRNELDLIKQKNDEIASHLDPKLYKRFSHILGQSAGKGIVPVTNAICGGCYMNIPPQLYIEVQRAENLYFCPQCQRMIYYKAEN